MSNFDPTLPENYFRCWECGEEQGFIALGLHCWLTCDTCRTAKYWGYGISEAGKDHTDAERAEALILLSQYRVASEDENQMAESEEWVTAIGKFVQHLRDDAS